MDCIENGINAGDTRLALEFWKHSGASIAGASEAFNVEQGRADTEAVQIVINVDGDGLGINKPKDIGCTEHKLYIEE